MSERQRFVFDNGVLVSAAIAKDSVPDRALERALAIGTLLASRATIAEFAEVLQRPKFERYLTPLVRERFLARIVEVVVPVVPAEAIRACRDPKDDMILELAVAGDAACIVTGDADLLVLDPFRSIPILTPRDFLDRTW